MTSPWRSTGSINWPGAIELWSRWAWCREWFSTERRTWCLRLKLLNKEVRIFYVCRWQGELLLVGAAGAFKDGSLSFCGVVDGATSVLQGICQVSCDDSNMLTWLYTINVYSWHHWTSIWNCWKMNITVPTGNTSGHQLIPVLSWWMGWFGLTLVTASLGAVSVGASASMVLWPVLCVIHLFWAAWDASMVFANINGARNENLRGYKKATHMINKLECCFNCTIQM